MLLKDVGNEMCQEFGVKCLPLSRIAGFCFLAMFATQPTAELHDRGNGLIYDDVQDLTWTQNAGMFFGPQYDTNFNGNYTMGATTWVENLEFGGFDDWRLPTTTQYDDPTCAPDARNTSEYNLWYEHRVLCTGGEMEMLTALYDPWNNPMFYNVSDTRYWTATPYRDEIDPCIHYPNYDVPCNKNPDNGIRNDFYWQWGFTGFPDQYGPYDNLPYKTTLRGTNGRVAWAVRDGDVIPSILAGDMNSDGLVNVADYLILTQFALGIRTSPTPDELAAGDMNGNGNFDAGDLVIHALAVLGPADP